MKPSPLLYIAFLKCHWSSLQSLYIRRHMMYSRWRLYLYFKFNRCSNVSFSLFWQVVWKIQASTKLKCFLCSCHVLYCALILDCAVAKRVWAKRIPKWETAIQPYVPPIHEQMLCTNMSSKHCRFVSCEVSKNNVGWSIRSDLSWRLSLTPSGCSRLRLKVARSVSGGKNRAENPGTHPRSMLLCKL